jgi:hypothetical protein
MQADQGPVQRQLLEGQGVLRHFSAVVVTLAPLVVEQVRRRGQIQAAVAVEPALARPSTAVAEVNAVASSRRSYQARLRL